MSNIRKNISSIYILNYMSEIMSFSNEKLDFSNPPDYYRDLPSSYIYVQSGKIGVTNVSTKNNILHEKIPLNLYTEILYIGMLNQKKCYVIAIEESEKIEFFTLRDLMNMLDSNLLSLAGRALQLMEFELTSKYCGKCGSLTTSLEDRGKKCTNCDLIVYPRISPAIIVMIKKDNEILMAKSANFKPNQFKTLISGFVEPGESLEHAVRREVREEIGIKIKNISYFASQPWPFPNSLMVGFLADYESGEINVDGKEILDAAWLNKDQIGEYNKNTINGYLLDWFVNK